MLVAGGQGVGQGQELAIYRQEVNRTGRKGLFGKRMRNQGESLLGNKENYLVLGHKSEIAE